MRRRLRSVAVTLTLLLAPSPLHLVLVPDANPYFTAALRPSDVTLLALVVLSVPELMRAARRPGPIGVLSMALLALFGLSLAVHPSVHGVLVCARAVGAVAIARTLLDLVAGRERRLVLTAVALSAAGQTLVAVAQLAGSTALLHDPDANWVGPFRRPNGTFPFAFVLAGAALLAAALLAGRTLETGGRFRNLWSAASAVALVPAAITFSRTAAIGYALGALVLGGLVARRRAGAAAALAAFVVGGLVPAILTSEGWYLRTTGSGVAFSATSRVALITQALPLIAASPLLGVGPGRTMAALRELEASAPRSIVEWNAPHNIPVAVALESGIPAGLIAAMLLLAVGLRAYRKGAGPLLAYLVLLPFTLLDNWMYTTAAGLILLGPWAIAPVGPAPPVTDALELERRGAREYPRIAPPM